MSVPRRQQKGRHMSRFPSFASAVFFLVGVLSGARAQNCDPPFLACTPNNAMGQPGAVEDFVTDLTYRGTLRQVWAVEAPRPGFNSLSLSRFTVYGDDLQSGRRSFNAGFTEPVFGIAEIPATH